MISMVRKKASRVGSSVLVSSRAKNAFCTARPRSMTGRAFSVQSSSVLLIRSVYPFAADVSDDPKAFARKIAYSKYISEVNGDNRAAYQALLVKVCRKISKLITHPINHNS